MRLPAALAPGDPWIPRLARAFRRFQVRKLADRNFKRRAAAFPLTRPFARASASRLFDLTAGFVYSQILKAVIELDLLAKLAGGPKRPDVVAGLVGLPEPAARRLLDAAAALDLVEARRDGAYEIAPLGAALESEPGVRAMIAHHDMLYADLADPVALLKGEAGPTRLSGFWPYAEGGADGVSDAGAAPYSELMARSQSFVAEDVLDAFSFGDRNSLLDLGGGEGAFAEAAARRWPHLAVTVVDLAPVAARARARIEAAGLSARVRVVDGDLLAAGDLPQADVVSLVRVLHDHDDPAVGAILRLARRSLLPSGEILIAEPLAGMSGAAPVGHAYFGFYLLAMGSGRPRSAADLAEMLEPQGFVGVRSRLTAGAMPLGIVTARRAGDRRIWRD